MDTIIPINQAAIAGPEQLHHQCRPAKLHAVFEAKQGRTHITDRYYEVPLRISRTFRLPGSDGELCVYTSDVSPGVMNGDAYESVWEIKKNAHVVLTSTSATRLHPTPSLPSRVNHTFHLEQGATLEYFPECVIPYAGSHATLSAAFHMQKDAVLIYADVWSAGRVHHGEIYDFIRFEGNTEVWRNNELVLWDRFTLEPRQANPDTLSSMIGYTHMASLWMVGTGMGSDELNLLRSLLPKDTRILAGASFLAGGEGIAVRMLGSAAYELQEFCITLWNSIRERVLLKPPLQFRK